MKNKRRLARYCMRVMKDHRYIDVFDSYDCMFTMMTCNALNKKMWFQDFYD